MNIEYQAYILPPKEDGKISTSKAQVEYSGNAYYADKKNKEELRKILDNHPFFYLDSFLNSEKHGFVLGIRSGIRTTEETLEMYLKDLLIRLTVKESCENKGAEVTYRIAYQ